LGLENRADPARRGVIPAEGLFVIDNPLQTELLIAKLKAAVPLSATVSRPLLALLQEQSPDIALPPRCQITGIHYTGDEGGILCKLDFGHEDGREVLLVSITHLTFDRRLPLAREIAAYQKHRVKRIRRSSLEPPSGPSH
jgi:hypothetical protein